VTYHSQASLPAQPLDAMLAEYVVGTLPRPLHALIGAHLDLAPDSGKFVSDLEAVFGAELGDILPVTINTRDRMLADIFANVTGPDAGTVSAVDDPVFTPAMLDYVGMPSRDVPWRTVLPGVKEYVISSKGGLEAKLYWIKAGRKMPSHTHDGQEVTLVLSGAFSDMSGHYRRGDVAIADQDIDHKPVSDPDEDCICFAVTDAPLKLTGPVGKFFQSIFRN
jgi:putative transcriptional regulator